MTKKYALYLTGSSFILCHADENGVQLDAVESLADKGSEDKLKELLAQYTPDVITVFLDVVGEEFKHESIPHVTGKDLALLLERKNRSLFPGAELFVNTHLERQKSGRKDDVFLMIGIPLPHSIEGLFNVLIKTGQKVMGVYSISILEKSIRYVFPTDTQCLTISRVLGVEKSKRSYRQTFSKDNELVISRVTRARGDNKAEVFDSLFNEIERMHHFLNGSKQLDKNHKLDVVCALSDSETKSLLSHETSANVSLKYFNLYDLAVKLGLKKPRSVESLPEILVNFALAKKIKPHFEPKKLCKTYQTWKLKRSIKIVSCIAVALAIVVSAGAWFNSFEQQAEETELREDIQRLTQQNPQHEVIENDLGISAQEIQQVAKLYQELESNEYHPGAVMAVLSKAYRGFNDVRIDEIRWVSKETTVEESSVTDDSFSDKLKQPRRFELVISMSSDRSKREVAERVNSFIMSLQEQQEVLKVEQTEGNFDTRPNAQMEETVGREKLNNLPVTYTLSLMMENI